VWTLVSLYGLVRLLRAGDGKPGPVGLGH
jgi:hypothetical protein